MSFVIADVRGYTAFTRERGDAEAARLATTFASLTGDAMASRGGRVIELRGDEALAVFDDAAQAVLAAVELQATLAEEAAGDGSLPLHVGVGIDTGEAVPVAGGYRGAALNMAARLCSRATAGQVLVTRAVCDASDGRLEVGEFRSLGAASFKGFELPVEVIEAVSGIGRLETAPVPAAARPVPPALAGAIALADRDAELAWLRGAWRGARRGAGRMLFVSGGDGMGKTSVAAVLAADVAGQGYEVLYAGAGGAALAALADACTRAAGARRPLLAVLDDLEAIAPEAASRLARLRSQLPSSPALVLGLTDDPDAVPAVAEIIREIDRAGDAHRSLRPLDAAAVREVAREYAGDDVDQVPIDSVVHGADGNPRRIHELLDAWVREEAGRRLQAAAEWLATGRQQREAGLALAHNAIERRLRRIYEGEAPEDGSSGCPYKGLAAFSEQDAERFFGRERLVGELAARTVGSGLLALVGPSGSGKSSLVLGGLLPSLHAGLLPGSGRWQTMTIRPGAHPLRELPARVLSTATAERRLVVAVDQFEEAFTLCEDAAERTAFIDRLIHLAADPDRHVVVLAVRGDFLDQIAGFPELAGLVSANQVLVGPMTRDEYRRAIERPAVRCGVRVESALTDAVIDEAVNQPGALPLLSTALVELWGRRSDGWMRVESFAASGGVHGAVARLAETSYQELTEVERAIARRVFLRLAGSGEGDAVTRARVAVADFDLDSDPATAAVIDRFVRDRLVTRDEGTIEVAHEALLREWPRLRGWLDEEGQGRALHHHLSQAARNWEANGRRAGDVYRAERLAAALAWRDDHGDQLNRLEREFLTASRSASTRAVRRLWAGVAILAVLLVAAAVAGLVALAQRRSAQHSAAAARAEAQAAIAERVGVQSGGVRNLGTALLLAAAAERLHPSPQTDSSLLRQLLRAGTAITTYHVPTRALGVAVSPDGTTVAAEENNGGVSLYDASTAAASGRLPPIARMAPPAIVFAPRGATLAEAAQTHPGSAAAQGMLVLADARTARVLARVTDHRPSGEFLSAAFSPDGRTLVAVDVRQPGLAAPTGPRLVALRLPGLHGIGPPVPLPQVPQGIVFAGPRRVLAIGAHSVTEYSARGLRPLRTYHASGAVLAPGNRTLAVTLPGRVGLLDLASGRVRRQAARPKGFHPSAFTPDGRLLAGILGNAVVTLDVASGALTTLGHERSITGVAVAPDGRSVYASSLDDQAVVRWGLESGAFWRGFRVAPAGQGTLVVSPGGRDLVGTLSGVQGLNGVGHVWDARTGRPVGGRITAGRGGIGWLAVSPDGRLVGAAAFTTGVVTLRDARTGAVVRTLEPPAPRETAWAAFSPDGRLFLTGTQRPAGPSSFKGGYIEVWNVGSGRLVLSLHQPGDNGVSTAVVSPDGRRLLSVGNGGSVALWGMPGGRLLRAWRTTDAYTVDGVFAPSERLVATGGYGGGLISLWDPRTAATGHDLRPPITSVGTVYPAGFFDGGRRLVVAGGASAESVQLWQLAGRRLLAALPIAGRAGVTPGAAITPDGRTLLTESTPGILAAWPLTPRAWVADACAIAHSRLSPAAWRTYFAGVPYRATC